MSRYLSTGGRRSWVLPLFQLFHLPCIILGNRTNRTNRNLRDVLEELRMDFETLESLCLTTKKYQDSNRHLATPANSSSDRMIWAELMPDSVSRKYI
ncbi:hypothetical protein F4815DRAFT_484897 [Daldinia loculata]|nr:hypothetical protein F4815DRAFT_484897 [Daldinia loculata]